MTGGGRRARWGALVLLGTLLAATACSGSDEDDGDGPDRAGTVRILASSELSDVQPLLDRAAEETGVTAEITWSGTLDATRQIVTPEPGSNPYDAVWLASNDYLRLHPGGAEKILSETAIMTSPVALGVRPETVDRLGWQPDEVTWQQVYDAAAAGELSFGMTDPTRSNSGYSALISVTTALSGAQAALTARDISGSAGELREFFAGQQLTSGSSGWLAEAFVRRGDVDALINYESVLLSLNREGTAGLTVIRPLDGVVTANYPLTTLTSASPEARESLRVLTDYLRGAEAQTELTAETLRRPVAAGVEPAPAIPAGQRRELPYPGSLEVADGLLDAYDDELRRPSRTLYLLDTSGSMLGDRIEALKDALSTLTGSEGEQAEAGDTFREREVVTLMPFNSEVVSRETYTVRPGDPEPALREIRAATDALAASGGTAIYRSLIEAYELLAAEPERDAFTSIVLMTDGENEDTLVEADDFEAFYAALPEEQRRIPVFGVLFGDSLGTELGRIAYVTGGRVFDAAGGSLTQAFQEIRGYQ